MFLWFVYISSCRQGLKVEKNKLVRTACICIPVFVIDIIMALKQNPNMHTYLEFIIALNRVLLLEWLL